ncbi:MAG TPA: acyl-ACP--UDP-N-acetylglucosamine O-acyltransferase [Oscillatoriales cyanobacterium M59_W2019_021]|nr:MAG: acyl-ACP--UDP-N-acetylglucosamine O-acyltransferase [Cyanobacteria bacterium J055]HIK33654.1 acyl-ACP--UDP-N-acetylglucosamine O-acyltransferase [Oscillatoriales cyanobacterium M4454_W2019_049]HIK52916.1 acyl-ACP--UDP-N-acetylglucosamine O-acyltransferase [Oscillatoriales cyanobacterium M59_W2019_021]
MSETIHPTAIIHPNAQLHPTVRVGAYAIVGERVKIDRETTIGPHVVIDGDTEIGAGNQIFPGAAIGLEPQDLKYRGANSRVQIGARNRIRECVTINRATGEGEVTEIGSDNLLMAYVHVAHNCQIGDRVVIANSVSLAGHVHIESDAVLGGMLGVHQFVRIGCLAMVGGMSRIDRDVPPYMLVEGNPSRVRSLNLVGLKRSGIAQLEGGEVFALLKKAFRILYRSQQPLEHSLKELEALSTDDHLQHLCQFLRSSIAPGRRGPTAGR